MFKVGDKVKIKQAVKPEHVGQMGEVFEVVGDFHSVRVKAKPGQDHEYDSLGCVPADHLESAEKQEHKPAQEHAARPSMTQGRHHAGEK